MAGDTAAKPGYQMHPCLQSCQRNADSSLTVIYKHILGGGTALSDQGVCRVCGENILSAVSKETSSHVR